MVIKQLVTLVAFGFMLAGCQSTDGNLSAPSEALDYSVEEYLIGVGDQLSISVWRNEELSVHVPVRPDGKVSVPLVGDVQSAGLSAEALSASLTEKLKEFIRSPQVTVIVANPSSADFQHRVRITGAVLNQTSQPFRKGMTVLDLVLLAGGTNEFAAANDAKLYRTTKEGTKVYPIYLQDILQKGKLETNYKLAPSDIITVPERAF